MIHFNHKGSTNVVDSGRFILANVLGDNGSVLTLDTDVPNISVTNYAAQVIAIPQFGNFTLSVENKSTPAFDGSQGGICALACKGTCNLSGGKLNVEQKGGGGAYARAGLAVIGNAQDSDKLPIGQGHGSVFILADKLTVNSDTRIGGTFSGKTIRGYDGNTKNSSPNYSGSGAKGGVGEKHTGGYGSNGGYTYVAGSTTGGGYRYQGAHMLIVANSISGFNQATFSSGGGYTFNGNVYFGGAGYGGKNNWYADSYGGYNGGAGGGACAGGSSGWAFIYCNNAINQATTGTVLAN